MTITASSLVWLLVPLLPLLAIASLLSPSRQVGHWLAVTVVPALLLAIWPQPSWFASGLWPSASWGVGELLDRTWLAFTAVLWGVATLYAVADQRNKPNERRFWVFWLLAMCGSLLLVIARDGVSFYVGFTLMSLSAYGLVVHTGAPEARRAGLLYLQLAVIGEMLLLAGLAMRAHAAGIAEGNPLALDFGYWQGIPLEPLTLGLILLGLGIKAGFWPLHIWLPQAHPVAPAAASAVLSGAMIKAGILGLWRFLPGDDPLLLHWAPALALVGLTGALLAALQGLLAARAKAVLAWSSVSQMGYLLMILAAGWWWPEFRSLAGLALLLYATHHAFAKGALFLGAGMALHYRLSGSQWAGLVLAALAMAGFVMTSGALAKTGLKELYYQAPVAWLLPLLSLGGVTTTLLLLRFLLCIRAEQTGLSEQPGPPVALWLPVAGLVAALVALPWVLPAWRAGMLTLLNPADLWALSWPLLLAMGVTALVMSRTGRRFTKVFSRVSVAGKLWIWLALRCRRWLLWVSLEPPALGAPRRWRQLERHWNRLWRDISVVPVTASLISLLLLLGWLW